jgi:hypothetical protein
MPPIPVNLAVQDELSETVVRRLLRYVGRGYAIGTTYGLRGNGYLLRNVEGWNRAARGKPFILLTDLDRYPCPSALVSDWLSRERHPNLIFRVAVREIEAWILADRPTFAAFLGVTERLIPEDAEAEEDPKRTLIAVARRSRNRGIRERIVPRPGSTAQQGPDYNACLSEFVATQWNIVRAAHAARSLSRTLRTFRQFTPTWPKR